MCAEKTGGFNLVNWLCARRLEQGKFHWAQVHQGESVALNPEQLQALIQGLPWQRIGRQLVVTML